MKRKLVLIMAMLCTLAMALPVMAHADSSNGGALIKQDKTHIVFGSYPQTEIVGEASQSGACDQAWEEAGDYLVDADLYASLQKAKYDDNGDTTIAGVKYRRLLKADAIHSSSYRFYYNWSDATTYHYFRYEPITWRILSNDGNDALLLAETVLDDQKYNPSDKTAVTWENSTIRPWLNETFINTAFTSVEQSAIVTTDVVNADNITKGIDGGENTQDKIFFLSEAEVYGDSATAYGFASSKDEKDAARQAKSSTYAKAMGIYSCTDSTYIATCWWWLRSPGDTTYNACDVNNTGTVNYAGLNVTRFEIGVRPALHLDLKASDLWSYAEAGRVTEMTLSQTSYTCDGTAKTPAVTIEGLTEGTDYTVSYSDNTAAGTATVTATGMGDYAGTLTQTFSITYDKNTQDVIDAIEALPAPENITTGDYDTVMNVSGKYEDLSAVQRGVIPTETRDKLLKVQKALNTLLREDSIMDISHYVNTVAESVEYTGQALQPEATVEGLTAGRDYQVVCSDNVEIGQATAVIQGIGNYKGQITKSFNILPAKASLTKLAKGKKKLTAYAAEQAGGVSYQFYVKRSGKSAKYYTSTGTKRVIKKLTSKKTYTVKVRAYKTVGENTYYGAWSETKKVKVK